MLNAWFDVLVLDSHLGRKISNQMFVIKITQLQLKLHSIHKDFVNLNIKCCFRTNLTNEGFYGKSNKIMHRSSKWLTEQIKSDNYS